VVIVAVIIVVEVVTLGAATPLVGTVGAAILAGMAAGAAGGALGAALYGGSTDDIIAGAIKGGVIGGLAGAASAGASGYFAASAGETVSTTSEIESVAAHGVISGARQAAEGGNFWNGVAVGVISAAVDTYGPKNTTVAGNVAKQSVIGGTSAAINGGKFVNGAIMGAFSYEFRGIAQQSYYNSRGSVLGTLWGLPNTALGLIIGTVGYGLSYLAYELDLTQNAPGITFGHNGIMFTNNILTFAPKGYENGITFGNVMIVSDTGAGTGEHEEQHTYQSEALGPAYLPANALSMITGVLTSGSVHGPAAFMEIGPQRNPPQPWPR
jgi:hypothetical protein